MGGLDDKTAIRYVTIVRELQESSAKRYGTPPWTTASSGLLIAVGATQDGEFAELSPPRAVSLDQTPSAIRSSRLRLDRPVRQGAIDDVVGAQLLPTGRPVDEVGHLPGRARNAALDQAQPRMLVDIGALGAHELAD
jgi:hypothetical protein